MYRVNGTELKINLPNNTDISLSIIVENTGYFHELKKKKRKKLKFGILRKIMLWR
jgi:hypothetical protein